MIRLGWIEKECHECAAIYQGSQHDDNLCRHCKQTQVLDRIAYALERLTFYYSGEEL